jgi:hypothetical protein
MGHKVTLLPASCDAGKKHQQYIFLRNPWHNQLKLYGPPYILNGKNNPKFLKIK